ncbi:MAG: outer membrane beta-barrel family protein, partial [Bacteroidota bacterium]
QIDRTVVNVQNSVTANGATALTILERSPGINIDRVNNQIAMQGKEGVLVMLNGKLMRMEGNALIQLLQNMPSDNIEKIELITTPPASYDAQGNAGIINIVTIKKEILGTNGTTTLNSSYGQRAKYGGSINLNFRKKKFNFFADLSANHDFSQQYINVERSNTYELLQTQTSIFSDRPAFTQLYNGRMGLDVYLTEQTTIGVLTSGYYRHWSMDADTETQIMDNQGGNRLNQLQVKEINKWRHWMLNFNLQHRFAEGRELSFDLDFLDYFDDNPINYLEADLDRNGTVLKEGRFSSTKETPIDFKVAKVDYQHQVSEQFKLQMGLKGTLSQFTNDLSLAREIANQWTFDPRFTDASHLDEKIGALYLSADYRWSEKLNTKMGLRYEYYDSVLDSEREGSLAVRQFGRFFPSIFLTYQATEDQQIQFSYSERINRPAFNNLAPTFFFWGFNTVFAGNPRVNPSISRQVSAAYRFRSLLLSMEFTDIDNPLTFQPEVLAEENLLIMNATNMQNTKTASLSINVPWNIQSWWESRYNLSGYWARLQPIFAGEVFTEETMYFTSNMTHNFKLPGAFQIELMANLLSPRAWGLGRSPFFGSVNLGLQKKVSDQIQLSLNWNNIFNGGSTYIYTFDEPDLNLIYDWRYQMEGNVLRLSMTWQFGDNQVKKVRQRQTGSEEERQRMN